MDHDSYWLFSRFWWLIFPLFWMVTALAWGWSRHSRANRALDIIKSYADQGKEPPPELLKNLWVWLKLLNVGELTNWTKAHVATCPVADENPPMLGLFTLPALNDGVPTDPTPV